MRKAFPAALLVLVLASSACEAKPKTYELSIGGAKLVVEAAVTDAEREKGLMFRKSVPEGTGMLFVFERDQKLSFWMKNTEVPLSIAYITSDGTIREILDMKPFSLAPVNSEWYVRYALEAPQGWYARAGVKVGDKVGMPPELRRE
jgi:uncharacterized protein